MSATLKIEPNIAAPEDFYEALIEMHRDLTPDPSRLVNARLILLLANHIGDAGVRCEAMAQARAGPVPGDCAAVAPTEVAPVAVAPVTVPAVAVAAAGVAPEPRREEDA